jgi:hypothetical protein
MASCEKEKLPLGILGLPASLALKEIRGTSRTSEFPMTELWLMK